MADGNTNTNTKVDKVTIMRVMSAMVEAIADGQRLGAGDGVPGGILYAAVMSRMTMDSFNMLMGGLVSAGAITKSGHFYKVTTLGLEYVAAVKRVEIRMRDSIVN